MADVTFYSTVAQVIPVLFLAVAIDRGGFTRSATVDEIAQIRDEERAKTDHPAMYEAAKRHLRQAIADASSAEAAKDKAMLLGAAIVEAETRAAAEIRDRHRRAVLKSTAFGTFTMLLLAVSEVAALKVTLTHNPSTVARLLCEFGLLFAGATLLFSLLDPEVQKIGKLRNWTLTRTQNTSTLATFCAIGLLTLVWRLL